MSIADNLVERVTVRTVLWLLGERAHGHLVGLLTGDWRSIVNCAAVKVGLCLS